jgi:hypothetical protein
VLRPIASPGTCAVGQANVLDEVAGALRSMQPASVWRPAPAAKSMAVKVFDIPEHPIACRAPASFIVHSSTGSITVLTCGASTFGNVEAKVVECIAVGLKGARRRNHAAPPPLTCSASTTSLTLYRTTFGVSL